MKSVKATGKTRLINARVFDGRKLTEPTTVVINGTVIGEDTDEAEDYATVDCKGGTLLPGLIDAHVHLSSVSDLDNMASYGVTTALDMACWPPSRVASIRAHSGPGTCAMLSAGLPATTAGSVHSCFLPLPADDMVSSPDEAAAFVAKRKEEGSDYIKLIADVPGPSQASLNALTREAHSAGLQVVAHAASSISWSMALDAGVDVITHVPRDVPVSSDTAVRLIKNNIVLVPTLSMMLGQSKPPTWAMMFGLLFKPTLLWAIINMLRSNPHVTNAKYENAEQSVKTMYEAGVCIVAGTDANMEEGSPCQLEHGRSLHDELELMTVAGMSNLDVLRSATCEAAKTFGLHDRGTVSSGQRADLILVDGDPLTDIKATRRIQKIWCQGVQVPVHASFSNDG